MHGLTSFVTRRPWLTIIGFLVATLIVAAGLPRIIMNADIEELIPADEPNRAYRNKIYDLFAIREPAVIMIVDDGPDGVFTPENFAVIAYLSEALSEFDGVQGDDLVSIADLDNIIGTEDSLDVVPFFEELPTTLEETRAIREAVMSNPMMVGTVVSGDGTATIVAGDRVEDTDKVAMYRELQEIVAAAPPSPARIEIGGWPVIEGEMGEIAQHDSMVMFPIVLAVAAAVLWLALRCLRGVVLPLLVVNASVIWAYGAMGWLGAYFYTMNVIMTIILVPIGIADGIHIIDHFIRRIAEQDRDGATINRRQATVDTMEELAVPVALTSLTTAVGLTSLVASEITSIQTLGLFSALGVMVAMVFSLTVLPALLTVLPVPLNAARKVGASRLDRRGPVAVTLDAVTAWVIRRPLMPAAITTLVMIACIVGFPRLTVDASLVNNFPKRNPVRIADDVAKQRFGGSMPAEIVLDGGGIDAWKDPAKLRALEKLQDALEADGLVAETRSIADFVKRMNQVMNPQDPDAYSIPDNQRLIAQYLLLYSMSGEPDDFDDVVDYDYKMANIRVQVKSDMAAVLNTFFDRVETVAAAELTPLGVTAVSTGAARTQNTLMRLIITGQVYSLAAALVIIVLMTSIYFRSPFAGPLITIPVGVATFVNFGALSWLGEPLGVTTAMVSSVGIGMGIDFAIHFAVRYRTERLSGLDRTQTMISTMRTAGTAIYFNALVVIAGFLVLIVSDFLPNRAFGSLIGLVMAVSFISTVTTLAGCIYYFDPDFLGGNRGIGTSAAGPRAAEDTRPTLAA